MKNPQLQRIYRDGFFSRRPRRFLNTGKAKKRDHRGARSALESVFHSGIGRAGADFWHPKGGIIRKEMEDWMRSGT